MPWTLAMLFLVSALCVCRSNMKETRANHPYLSSFPYVFNPFSSLRYRPTNNNKMDRTSWESALLFSLHVAPVTVKEVPVSPTSVTANPGPDARLTGCKSLAFPMKPAGRSVTLPLPCAPLDHHMDFSLSPGYLWIPHPTLFSHPPAWHIPRHTVTRKFGLSDFVIFLLPTVWGPAVPAERTWLSLVHPNWLYPASFTSSFSVLPLEFLVRAGLGQMTPQSRMTTCHTKPASWTRSCWL